MLGPSLRTKKNMRVPRGILRSSIKQSYVVYSHLESLNWAIPLIRHNIHFDDEVRQTDRQTD